MEVITILAIGFICMACFLMGAKVGNSVAKGEDIKFPINPMLAAKERQAKQEAELEQNRLDTILKNIERYDGTSAGQKEVTRG